MLSAIETKLGEIKVDNKALFIDVGSALSLASVMNTSATRSPAAFVVPISEQPQSNHRDIGAAMQDVQVELGVLIVLTSRNDPSGAKGAALLAECRTAVKKALYGWQPMEGFEPLLLARGDLVKMAPNVIYWMDRFTTIYTEEANH